MIKHFPKNEDGRDFAVGDIHGCYGQLQRMLAACHFDNTSDRLFSVGDLIDRGPESERVAALLTEPWFHAVRGNHEAMAIDMLGIAPDRTSYRLNGGDWFFDLSPERQLTLVAHFKALPIGLDIETRHGLVGLVHAEMTAPDWTSFCAALSDTSASSSWAASAPAPSSPPTLPTTRSPSVTSASPRARQRTRKRLIEAALWSRDRIMHDDRRRIPDLHALVVGHTPVPRVKTLGNVHYIDTGAVFNRGALTIIDLAELVELP